ncbi:ABC transporter permease [Patescibacteria group bacterium]|nr:ABC transporter permease [Patescibacteria group bacterium]
MPTYKELKLAITLAAKGLRANMFRSILTTIGIVIGIFSVIVVLAGGRGLENFIIEQVEMFGADTIEIEMKLPSVSDTEMVASMMGGAEVTTLKKEDFEALLELPNVDNYYAAIIGQYKAVYKNKDKRAMIFATTAGMPEVETATKMEYGRFFTEKEDRAVAKVVVLGSKIKEQLFGEENAVGKNVKINQINFKVIGIAEERGAMFTFDYDKMIYMPLKTGQKLLLGVDHVLYGFLSVHDASKVKETANEMISIMEIRHNIEPGNVLKQDFRVMSMQEAMEMMGAITLGMTIMVLAVAGISLVVGGVGIMNIMYLTVIERTREIGLRKAIGAPASLIQLQFLCESTIITLIGGIVGIVLGWIVVLAIKLGAASQGFNFDMVVTWDAIAIALGASIMFGIIFGLYPARKASHLKPVDALRYE